MKLELKKFGKMLISRPAGREAWLAAKAYALSSLPANDNIEVDFSGVLVLTPSWADEFLTPLKSAYQQRVVFLPNSNPSVVKTLSVVFA